MATIEELKAAAAAAKARKQQAALSDEEAEHHKLLAEIAADTEAARADEAKRRAVLGAQKEGEAKKAAQGKYLVQFFDLGRLLPDAEAAMLPGGGVLVLRSPPPDALASFYREIEAGSQDLPQTYAGLVVESVVFPDISGDAEGMKFRAFLDGPIGCGTVIAIGDAATTLGGVVAKKTKRGRG